YTTRFRPRDQALPGPPRARGDGPRALAQGDRPHVLHRRPREHRRHRRQEPHGAGAQEALPGAPLLGVRLDRDPRVPRSRVQEPRARDRRLRGQRQDPRAGGARPAALHAHARARAARVPHRPPARRPRGADRAVRAVPRLGVHRGLPAQGQDRGRRPRPPRGEGHGHHRRRRQDRLHRRRQGVRAADRPVHPHPHGRDGRAGRLVIAHGLFGGPGDLARMLRGAGFADPAAAVANLEALTPTPRDAELLGPALPRLLSELAAAPDPDMALNNLERYAAAVDRAVLFGTLAEHPGAAPLLARVGGASQFLADVLRRRPSTLAWLLEPRTMRPWLAEEFAEDVAQAVRPFSTREARLNALRRFKYRQLLRIGARDLLGDADLA